MSLVELIVSIAIIAIITTIIFASMSADRSHREAKITAAKFQAALQDAQNKAQSGQSVGGFTGYGVRINSLSAKEFINFGDLTASGTRHAYSYSPVDETISKIKFQEAAQFKYAFPPPALDIVFDIPDGKVFVIGSSGPTTMAKVVFADKNGQYCYAVTVTGAGTISKPQYDPSCT